MFDGTDISLVYGEPANTHLNFPQQQPPQQTSPIQPNHATNTSPPPPIPETVYMKEVPPAIINNNNTPPSQPSFWDRMGMKKDEIFKLFIFSMIILLAIAMDKAFFHYLKTYIEENMLSWSQEFMIRLMYPVLILVLLWIMKSL